MNNVSGREVTVNLRGGLGNQLFQYGAGFAVAEATNSRLVIDTSLLPSVPAIIRGVAHWPEQISQFISGAEFVRSTIPSPLLSRLLQVERLVGDVSKGRLTKYGSYSNESFSDADLFHHQIRSIKRVNSYCGSAAFFKGHEDRVRQNISTLANPSEAFQRISEMAMESKPIGIHIRLGDYKNLPLVYGRFDASYFARSLDLLRELVGASPVWLFSDQPDLLGELLPKLSAKNEAPAELKSLSGLETILVMAQQSGLVCSNSSFSWWGAFLNQRPQFRAVFPSPLFAPRGPSDPKNFIQPGWLQLGRDFDA